MKWIVLLIPLLLVLSGCISEDDINYQSGFGAGVGSKSDEIRGLDGEIKVLNKDIKWFKKELERKSDVTGKALGNEAEFISELGVNNERLQALETAVENLEGNVNKRISDMNSSVNQGLVDLNVLIYDLNEFC